MTIQRIWKLPDASPVKVWTDHIEPAAKAQLDNLAQLPFIHKHIACMPDVHAGYGSTIGSVIATKNAIIPSAVGVDIGCGMNAVRLNLTADDLPDNLSSIRSAVESRIPLASTEGHGDNIYDNAHTNTFRFSAPHAQSWWNADLDKRLRDTNRWYKQLGTLGTGNHFIELCLDEAERVWVMLHSGSRGIGNLIGSHFIDLAKRDMEKWFIHLPDNDLAYFPEGTKNFHDYWSAVHWAQDYALENRRQMMRLVIEALNTFFPEVKTTEEGANCHHNYVAIEHHFGRNVYVTRKGAVRARSGDIGIIPGSMGTRSYITRGLGNPDSFCSCSHGAGRIMSRTKARETFTAKDLAEQTRGVECRKDDAIIDEIPGAYKDIDKVMTDQEDLVEILHTLKAVMCIKG